MAALGAQSIASSYEQLLHVDRDGGGNSTTHVAIKDGDNGTTFGFTIATDALMMSSTNRLEFGDTGTYIHQSADGVLDLVSDTEIEINATTIDINGAVAMDGAMTGGTNITISGELDAATLDISGNADIDGILEADAYTVDGTALDEFIADTVGAMVGSNTETGVAVTYEDGDNTLDFVLGAAQTTITSLLAADIKIGEDDETKIDFETANEIHFYANNTEQVYVADNIFGPEADSDVDLGTTGVRWKDAFVDSITVTGEVDAATLDISGAVDIDGAVDMASTLEVKDVLTVTKSVSAGSAAKDTAFLTLSATDAGVNMSGGEGAAILFKIPDDETNPSIGASIAGIKENSDDSQSQTALSFNVSQNDETLDEAMRITSAGAVGIGVQSPAYTLDLASSDAIVSQFTGSSGETILSLDNTSTNGDKWYLISGGSGGSFASGKFGIFNADTSKVATSITNDGEITQPNQPAFCVILAADTDKGTGTEYTLATSSERFDQGSNFASNAFTAPVTGKYQLNIILRLTDVPANADYITVQVKTSNDNYSQVINPTSAKTFECVTMSVLADMDASDTAHVTFFQSGGTGQTNIDGESHFSGYLAC